MILLRYIAILSAFILSSHAKIQPFTFDKMDKAFEQDQRVILNVYAPWCGHCFAQHGVIKDIQDEYPYEDMLFLEIPYSGAEDIKSELNEKYINAYNKKNPKKQCHLDSRSTIVVMEQKQVVACNAFLTSYTSITQLIKTPLKK